MKFENRTPFDVRVSTDALSSEWLVMESRRLFHGRSMGVSFQRR